MVVELMLTLPSETTRVADAVLVTDKAIEKTVPTAAILAYDIFFLPYQIERIRIGKFFSIGVNLRSVLS